MKGTEPILDACALRFSKSVCDRVFVQKDMITGPELRTLSSSGQINALLISYIQSHWTSESDAFRSSFFDYSHPEVVAALQVFRNVVSRHIALSRATLESLLTDAALEYLFMALRFDQWCAACLRSGKWHDARYTKIYQEGIALVRSGTGNYSPSKEEQEAVIAQLNTEFALELSDWQPLSTDFPLTAQKKETLLNEEVPTISTLEPVKSTGTLIEKLTKEHKKPLLQQVSLNQKIMFQKALFGNNPEDYQTALATMDTLLSFDAALDYLKTHFAVRHHWDFESDEVGELLELLEHRFLA